MSRGTIAANAQTRMPPPGRLLPGAALRTGMTQATTGMTGVLSGRAGRVAPRTRSGARCHSARRGAGFGREADDMENTGLQRGRGCGSGGGGCARRWGCMIFAQVCVCASRPRSRALSLFLALSLSLTLVLALSLFLSERRAHITCAHAHAHKQCKSRSYGRSSGRQPAARSAGAMSSPLELVSALGLLALGLGFGTPSLYTHITNQPSQPPTHTCQHTRRG